MSPISNHIQCNMLFDHAPNLRISRRVALSLVGLGAANAWISPNAEASAPTAIQRSQAAAPIAVTLGEEALPFFRQALSNGGFHNIDWDDVKSILELPGDLLLGSVRVMPAVPDMEARLAHAALVLADRMNLSCAAGFICFIDAANGINGAKCVINTLSACTRPDSHRLYGLKTSHGIDGEFRATVLVVCGQMQSRFPQSHRGRVP